MTRRSANNSKRGPGVGGQGPDGCPPHVRRGGISPAIKLYDGRGYPSPAQVWRIFIR
ncbi:MAG: hypothetical protein HYX78_15175 [Armatimonadetes bacterium]|nr:hypothetical protein [Armatimonadota bacterium]